MKDIFYITNGVTHDGFGSRMQRCISVMCLVYRLKDLGYNVEYLHTPFSYLGFDENYDLGLEERLKNGDDYPYNDNSHDGYMLRASKWDEYLGFKGKTINDIDINSFDIINNDDPLIGYHIMCSDVLNKKNKNKIYVIKMLHFEYDNGFLDIGDFLKYRDKILADFSFKKYEYKGNAVSVHIRRKDAINYENRYIPDSYYIEILKKLEKSESEYDITIYTQKSGFDDSLYSGYKIIYDDTENDYETFNKLIFSDYLVVGKSSFSYAAALLNKNTVVYHWSGHKGQDSWINNNEYINLIK